MKNNKISWFRSQFKFAFIGCLSLFGLTGCQSLNETFDEHFTSQLSSQQQTLESTGWAVLPFVSHVEVPQEASTQLERILLVQLPDAGITNLSAYQKPQTRNPIPPYVAETYELERARLWAMTKQVRYTLSGEILEWQYDDENRFSTQLNLKVMDIATGEELWSLEGLGEGQPGEESYIVSRKVIMDLLAALPIDQP